MSLAKHGLSHSVGGALSRLVEIFERRGDSPTTQLRVLTYNRVATAEEEPGLYPGLISATPEAFERQVAFLAANCRVLSFEEMRNGWESGSLPPRSVMVTFDDAYRDFARHAWPILKHFGVPAVLFVPTAFPDSPHREFWWDRLYRAVCTTSEPSIELPHRALSLRTPADKVAAVRWLIGYLGSLDHEDARHVVEQICASVEPGEPQNAVLGWDDLRRLAAEGVTLGAHTQTHPLLNRVPVDQAQEEAIGSLRDLEREIGAVPRIISYPSGGRSVHVARMLDDAGFEFAFSTAGGVNDIRRADRLGVRRINVGQQTTEVALRRQLGA